MPGRERLLFSEPGAFITCTHAGTVSLIDGTVYTISMPVLKNDVAVKAEPSFTGSIGNYSRMVAWVFDDSASNNKTVQLQMSRDDTNWESLGSPITPTTIFNGNYIGSANPTVFSSAFPAGFMQSAAGAVDIDDEMRYRFEVVADGTGPIRLSPIFILLPTITASQSKPMRGNVFSGAQY